MVVATCTITLELPGARSLKEKRRIVKSILARLHQEYNVAAAEVDGHDYWQSAVLGLAIVGNDKAHCHRVLEKCVAWVEQFRPDTPIGAYHIEFR